MPTLPVLDAQARQLLANQKQLRAKFDEDKANYEFWRNLRFAIKFVACALASTGFVFFLVAYYGLR